MASFKLLITFLLVMCPTNWAISMTSSDSLLVSSKSPSSSLKTNEPTPESAAATLGDLYRKSRQSRCVRCYDDRYGDDYERSRYTPPTRGGGVGGTGYPYPSRTYDERPTTGNWYYPRETSDRYDESRVGYGGGRENDRYYYPYNGYYFERNEDRYNTRSYDRYERDRYDSRYSHERSPSETRGYGHGYESRDRYYPYDRSIDYYRGGDRYSDRNRVGVGGSIYDRFGQDDRYNSRYDFRNYRPWDETYRGQSGFDNTGRGYYFASERPTDYYEPPPPPPPPYGPQSRPLGPGLGPSTPGPTYLPRDPHEQSRPSNSHHGYPDDRPGSSSSSSGSSASGSDYNNRPRDDGHGHGSGTGGGGSGSSNGGSNSSGGGGGDNKNGYTSGSWSYANDREKDANYNGGNRDKDNQSSPYGGGRGRPSIGGSYLLDRDNNNVPETSMAINNPDKSSGDSQISDSPMASKLTAPSSSTSKLTEDRVTESKDSN